MKIQINLEKRHLLLLVAVIAIATIGIVLAAKPNPGHSASEIEGVVTDVRMICSWDQTTGSTCPLDYTTKDKTILSGPIYCVLCIKLT